MNIAFLLRTSANILQRPSCPLSNHPAIPRTPSYTSPSPCLSSLSSILSRPLHFTHLVSILLDHVLKTFGSSVRFFIVLFRFCFIIFFQTFYPKYLVSGFL
ncbi:hypothetical protein E2C01_065187 [Portunus trituberculatus]|uniref:Uncharacterized protein n=1 Tax=Portunus trituberculatus TaxID=210409 RepID=A0A5B7HR19_PORTR|nr:hypothetical protein [Portunus trituberculatus]